MAQLVEQLTCNQQVVGSIPITSSNVEDFPSGQRGQTVNLLALLSVVRIHHPPPKKKYADVAELADALDLGSSAFGVGVRLPSSAPIVRKWLNGRAPPCQGGCCGFESRLSLQICGYRISVILQPSKLERWVRFPLPAPKKDNFLVVFFSFNYNFFIWLSI